MKERIRENLHTTCTERMDKMSEEFAALFADPVERITGLLSERVEAEMPMTAAVREDWPPCFESAVSELNQGVNVNHVGRVFLAAFSKSVGMSQEQTCSFFANAPDYSADTTSYQVNQIYERDYTPHGCAALKTSARCPVQPGDDRLCDQEWLTHPLKYLRAKQRSRYREVSQAAEESEVVEDEVEHHGEFIDLPSRPVHPKPLQDPHPPLYQACTGTESLLDAAARGIGALVLGFGGPGEVAAKNEAYRRAFAERRPEDQVGFAPNEHLAALCPAVVLDDGVEARRIGLRGQRFFLEAIAHWGTVPIWFKNRISSAPASSSCST